MSRRLAEYKTPWTTKLYDQLKKQNKTERRVPWRDVQPLLSCEPLLGSAMYETLLGQFPFACLLQAFMWRAPTSNKSNLLSIPLTRWGHGLPLSEPAQGFSNSQSWNLQLRIFPYSVSFLSIFLHNMVVKNKTKCGNLRMESTMIFLFHHCSGYLVLLGYKQHVTPLTPQPFVVFWYRHILENTSGCDEEMTQEDPNPGLLSLSSLPQLTC